MVMRGIDESDIFEYICKCERDLPFEEQTKWGLRPQLVAQGNKFMARQGRALSKRSLDSVADAMTRVDRSEFLDAVAWVKLFWVKGESAPREFIDKKEDLSRVFDQLLAEQQKEIVNAARDYEAITESEKKGSSSSSGAALKESTATGSVSTASDAPNQDS